METQAALRREMAYDFVQKAFEEAFGVEYRRKPFSRWLWSLAEADLGQQYPPEVVYQAVCQTETSETTPPMSSEISFSFAKKDRQTNSSLMDPETWARNYILAHINGKKPIDPREICQITNWDASKIRQFVAQVQDDLRVPAGRRGPVPAAGLSALIAAVNGADEDDDDEDAEPSIAALQAIEKKPKAATAGSNTGRFSDKVEAMCFHQAEKRAQAKGETFDEETWKMDFRARRASKEAANG